jgi:hypothetical protein
MTYVFTFLAGAVVGGAGIGYLAYNYGKKAVAVVSAVKQA